MTVLDTAPDPLAGYRTLTMPDLEALRRERVRLLEVDHFRTRLLLEEASDVERAAALHGQLGELERRIGVHCDPVEAPADDEPKPPADEPATAPPEDDHPA